MLRTPHVLLVHGAWHGSWCWDLLVPPLRERGLTVSVVDLPSAGGDGDLSADAAVVSAALDASGGPSVVVGHSYGGQVITQATAGRSDVGHLVYLAAVMLDVGESQMSVLGGALPPWIDVQTRPGYILSLMPEPVFYGDVESQVAATCAAQLRSQSVSSFVEPLTAAGWREHPSTYITCTEDQAIPPNMQEVWSARAGAVHALPSSHSPFLSRQDELADLIADAAG